MNEKTTQQMTRPHAKRGFSMVELILVLVIMTILGSMAAPRYAGFSAQRHLDGAERRLIADLGLAQRHARQSSASQTVTFDVNANKYQLVGMQHPDHPGQPFEVRLSDEPYHARVVVASFGGDANLIYDGYGAPDSSGTIVIAVGAYQKTINIEVGTGKPRKLTPVIE